MNKNKIAIVTDSMLDLWKPSPEDVDAHVVPLTITLDGKSYIDRVTLTYEELHALLRQSDEIPSSSRPNPQQFLELYNDLYDQGYTAAVSIHASEKLSGTINSARQAAKKTKLDVRVFDSRGTSGQLGILAIFAHELLQQDGITIDEAAEKLEYAASQSNVRFIPETLENLVKGGRLSKAGELAASVLGIKVVVATTKEGGAVAAHKARGLKRAFDKMADDVLDYFHEQGDKIWVMFGDGTLDGRFIEELREKLIERDIDFEDKGVFRPGATITTHVGTNAFGYALCPSLK